MPERSDLTKEEIYELFGYNISSPDKPNITYYPNILSSFKINVYDALKDIIQEPFGFLGISIPFEVDGTPSFYCDISLLKKMDLFDIYENTLYEMGRNKDLIEDIEDFALTPFRAWSTDRNQQAMKLVMQTSQYDQNRYVMMECNRLVIRRPEIIEMTNNIRNFASIDGYLKKLFEYSDFVIWPEGTDNCFIAFACKPEKSHYIDRYKKWCDSNGVRYCTVE